MTQTTTVFQLWNNGRLVRDLPGLPLVKCLGYMTRDILGDITGIPPVEVLEDETEGLIRVVRRDPLGRWQE